MKSLLVAVLLIAGPVAAQESAPPEAAQEANSPVEVLGFSPDDRYVAFIEHGTADGSGFPWAKLVVLEVAKGKLAAPPVNISLESGAESDTEDAAVAQARKAASKVMKKLGIASWTKARKAVPENGQVDSPEGQPIGTLEVKTRSAPKGERAKCPEPFRARRVEVKVVFLDPNPPPKLVSDRKAQGPECLGTCTPGEVYGHGTAALVFAKCQVPGFEGPATANVPLTGKLPFSLVELPQQ